MADILDINERLKDKAAEERDEAVRFIKDNLLCGHAICLNCNHESVLIAPIGTVRSECGECGMGKQVWRNAVCRDPDEEHWQCNCGCFVFGITRNSIYCHLCGKEQSF